MRRRFLLNLNVRALAGRIVISSPEPRGTEVAILGAQELRHFVAGRLESAAGKSAQFSILEGTNGLHVVITKVDDENAFLASILQAALGLFPEIRDILETVSWLLVQEPAYVQLKKIAAAMLRCYPNPDCAEPAEVRAWVAGALESKDLANIAKGLNQILAAIPTGDYAADTDVDSHFVGVKDIRAAFQKRGIK